MASPLFKLEKDKRMKMRELMANMHMSQKLSVVTIAQFLVLHVLVGICFPQVTVSLRRLPMEELISYIILN